MLEPTAPPLAPPLPRATPESQGVPTSAVRELIATLDRVDSIHGLMIVRHGHVIAEADWAPYRASDPQHIFSISKSFLSTAFGFAIAEGLVSLDDRIVDLFPESAPAVVDDRVAALRIRHLLAMASGHPDDTMDALFAAGDGDWVAAFLAVPLEHDPGTHFFYNTGASYVLSAVAQKVTGQRLLDYLGPRLFEPLGIEGASWAQSPSGVDLGGFGLSVRLGDIAALGELYLRRGRWGDRQLLPADWVDQATSAHSDNSADDGTEDDWAQGYGYQFWRSTHGYRGDGAFGQYCLVIPEHDLVVAITGSLPDMQLPLYPFWEGLLPSLSDAPLDEDPDAAAALAADVTRLSVPAPGMVRGDGDRPRVDGVLFDLEANDHGFETVSLRVGDASTSIVLRAGGADTVLEVGFGEWVRGTFAFWPEAGTSFAARGGWVGEREFRARVVSTALAAHRRTRARVQERRPGRADDARARVVRADRAVGREGTRTTSGW